MGKKYRAIHTMPLVIMAVAGLFLGGITGCSSNKAGMAAPELPARHWLDDAPGIPIEGKEKYDAAIPNLYKPDKKFGFEECVYLTIQQSPMLVNSAVNIELKRLDETSAAWKYLPEPSLSLRVSQNITQFNRDARDVGGEYGQLQYEIGFYAPFPNPVATYYENKAQKMLTGVAISTHRKAVSEAIFKIAETYLRLQAEQRTLEIKRVFKPIAHEMTDYWKQVEKVDGNQGSSLVQAREREREAELIQEKAAMEETMRRTELKLLAGLEPHQRFEIDASHATDIVKDFDGTKISWEKCWEETEDHLMLRTQIKLSDFLILLAWAQYVPNMSMAVNMSPPRGQSQPASGTADQFFHFTFDFPLIDWGRRYRGVQTARMKKAQAFHALAEKRFEYQGKWIRAEQETSLALTNLKLAQVRFKTAQMKYNESRISFEHGLALLPEVARHQEEYVNARINFINAELNYNIAKLNWMYKAGALQKRFLGMPSRELSRLVGVSHAAGKTPAGEASKPMFGADVNSAGVPALKDSTALDSRPIGKPSAVKVPEIVEPSPSAPAAPAPKAPAAPDSRPVGKPSAAKVPELVVPSPSAPAAPAAPAPKAQTAPNSRPAGKPSAAKAPAVAAPSPSAPAAPAASARKAQTAPNSSSAGKPSEAKVPEIVILSPNAPASSAVDLRYPVGKPSAAKVPKIVIPSPGAPAAPASSGADLK